MTSVERNLAYDKKIQNETSSATLARGIESFTTDLHKCVASRIEGNFVVSGPSVHVAASLCAFGAQDRTAKLMFDVLRINYDIMSSDFKNFIVTRLQDSLHAKLRAANRIFTDKSIIVRDSFNKCARDHFASDVIHVDFVSRRGNAADVINNWVAMETDNASPKLLTESSIDASTTMIVANVAYFQSCWMQYFDRELTKDEPFFLDAETIINVPTMNFSDSFEYQDLKSVDAECVVIPYENVDYSFVIIRPRAIDGLKQLEMNLHKVQLDFGREFPTYKRHSFRNVKLNLGLPKFKIESQMNLNGALEELGLSEVLHEYANMRGISETRPLYVNKVLQMAFISVDEIQTQPTAAQPSFDTVRWPIRLESSTCRQFKVDRPFLYRIVKKSCNLTLLSGRVAKPTCE